MAAATDCKTVYKASTPMQWARKTRRAYRVCAHLTMMLPTWSDAYRPSVIVTPIILIDMTRTMSERGSMTRVTTGGIEIGLKSACDVGGHTLDIGRMLAFFH